MRAFIQFAETRADGTRGTFQTIGAPVEVRPLWWQEKGLSFTASGYGARIPTRYVVQLHGRWRRVYCHIYSNSGTCFIGRNIRTGQIVQIEGAE